MAPHKVDNNGMQAALTLFLLLGLPVLASATRVPNRVLVPLVLIVCALTWHSLT